MLGDALQQEAFPDRNHLLDFSAIHAEEDRD
jgi:hypothetical protein